MQTLSFRTNYCTWAACLLHWRDPYVYFWYTSCTRMFRFCSWRLWHPLYSYTTVTTGTELLWFHSCFLSPPRFLGFSSSGHALWSNPGTVFATASGHPVVLRPGRPSQDLPQEVRWYNLGSPLVVVCLEMPSRWYICITFYRTLRTTNLILLIFSECSSLQEGEAWPENSCTPFLFP